MRITEDHVKAVEDLPKAAHYNVYAVFEAEVSNLGNWFLLS